MNRKSTRLSPNSPLTQPGIPQPKQFSQILRRWGVFGEARTRILLWYVGLMSCSAIVTVVAIRQILSTRLEERVQRSLIQEVEEFRQLTTGRNPATGEPFGNDIEAIFNVFLDRNIPESGEFFITLSNNQFYRSSPRAIPNALKADLKLIHHLAQFTHPKQGEVTTSNGETLLYIAEPIIRGARRGVFVVVYSTAGERKEIDDAVLVVTEVTLGVLAVASILAWNVAGRVLAPLSLLTKAARSVSESDLTQRLPVRGNGELAKLARTFNEMMDRLQSAFDSQRNFLNDAGHELRTPITIVRGHLELMGNDPEEQQATVELVLDELDRMSRLVNDLILLAKAERPDFLQLETVDLRSLTEELFNKTTALGNRNWRLDALGKGLIVIDRQRLTQAVMNLAQNAIQYTQSTDTIALGSSLRENQIRFWVRDTGKGISPEDQERIFQRFVRGANSQAGEGTGLGLAIVQAIVEAHNGRIELHSQLDVGSTFTLIIPLELAQ